MIIQRDIKRLIGKALIAKKGCSLVKINKDNVLLHCHLTPHPCGATQQISLLDSPMGACQVRDNFTNFLDEE